MEWPSKRIPQGGMLHPAKASYNPQTRQFLKVLLEESKFDMMYRKESNLKLRSHDPLPQFTSRSSVSVIRKPPPVLIRPGPSRKRSKDVIETTGAYERQRFVPSYPVVDRDKAKKHLQDFMAFGKDMEPMKQKILAKLELGPESDEPLEETPRFEQLLRDIKEREAFLKQMTELGEAKKHKAVIEHQIRQKLREMEKLKHEMETRYESCSESASEAA